MGIDLLILAALIKITSRLFAYSSWIEAVAACGYCRLDRAWYQVCMLKEPNSSLIQQYT